MIKAVIFDFDGTILDTESPWYDAVCDVYRQHGAEMPLELYVQCVGSSLEHFDPYSYLQQLIPQKVNRDDIARMAGERHAVIMREQTIRPGVESYLKSARKLGLKIGLASSSDRKWIDRYLDELGIREYFDCIRTKDDVKQVKPDPELYLQAAQCLGVQPREAVAFEDSPNGTKAAKAAGMSCVIVPNRITANLLFEAYELRLQSLADMELADLIRQLEHSANH